MSGVNHQRAIKGRLVCQLGEDPAENTEPAQPDEPIVQRLVRTIFRGRSAGNVRAINGKMIYYVESVVNPKKGVIVIVSDGKIQSMMPSNLKSFNKMQ